MHDIQKLQNDEFYLFGLLCCVGILKGCAGPRRFLPSVVAKIFLGTSTKKLSIKEIPDLDIQLKLQTIADVKTEDEFQNILDTFPERFCLGSEEIQNFKRGLEQYGLYSILSTHFGRANKEFSLSQGITSKKFIKLFQVVLYSDASVDDTKKK